jgi:Uma2 family endonuclease
MRQTAARRGVPSIEVLPMSTQTRLPAREDVIYPDSDGQPMAENTLQFEWITTIKGGLDALFRDDPNVFVAGDLLWYPVEGDPTIRIAPDALVVFGRPKGYRGSYMQWREDDIAPQVVFEVTSPGNRAAEMTRKFHFYERYGVEEYYLYDPDHGALDGWLRSGTGLEGVPEMRGWVSPRLGIRFDLVNGELVLQRPGGRPFLPYVELSRQRDEEHQRAEAEHQRAEAERERAEAERLRAEAERERAERLAAQLKALGAEPEA